MAASDRCLGDWRLIFERPGDSGSTSKLFSESICKFTPRGIGTCFRLTELVAAVLESRVCRLGCAAISAALGTIRDGVGELVERLLDFLGTSSLWIL